MKYSIDHIPDELKFRKGAKHTIESKKRMSDGKKRFYANGGVHPLKGKKHSVTTKNKISAARLGTKSSPETRAKLLLIRKRGEEHPRWVKDRSLLSKKNERNDSAYREWRLLVWRRDNFKCRIADNDCKGRIEAHHILGWTEYPLLRYKPNNGITLCHAHHPRKRAEEKRLALYFSELVSVSSFYS